MDKISINAIVSVIFMILGVITLIISLFADEEDKFELRVMNSHCIIISILFDILDKLN